VLSHAVSALVPGHLDEVRQREEQQVAKTMAAARMGLLRNIRAPLDRVDPNLRSRGGPP